MAPRPADHPALPAGLPLLPPVRRRLQRPGPRAPHLLGRRPPWATSPICTGSAAWARSATSRRAGSARSSCYSWSTGSASPPTARQPETTTRRTRDEHAPPIPRPGRPPHLADRPDTRTPDDRLHRHQPNDPGPGHPHRHADRARGPATARWRSRRTRAPSAGSAPSCCCLALTRLAAGASVGLSERRHRRFSCHVAQRSSASCGSRRPTLTRNRSAGTGVSAER